MEFIVLPDSAHGAALAASLGEAGTLPEVLPHASGRPWLLGRWGADEVVWATAGRLRLAVLGCSSADRSALEAVLRRCARGAEADTGALARSLAGSFFVVLTDGERSVVQGSASGVRRVFHARVGGSRVAADRPARLARLVGARIDDEAFLPHLLLPLPPWPLGEASLWRGVARVPDGERLETAPDGGARTVPWWTCPEPDLPAAEAVAGVRAAVAEAVAARSGSAAGLSADLSGGMDSTSLCFLAAREPGLTTVRLEPADPANEDERWASRAALALPAARHTVLGRAVTPRNFAGLAEPDDPPGEAPFPWLRARALLVHQAAELAGRGVTVHLTGHGGDELFQAWPAHDHTLLRRRPLRAARQLGRNRAMRRWRLLPTVRELLDGRDYGPWLAAGARALGGPAAAPGGVATQWGRRPELPPWVTPEATDAVRERLLSAAGEAVPLARYRGQHQMVESVRQCAGAVRLADQLTGAHGVRWHAPFLDDRVVTAALAVDTAEHATADRYKPVLAAAMRGTVPDTVLDRPTKGEFSADVHAGLRHHKAELVGLCDDMALARCGLVDAEAFRAALVAPHPGPRSVARLLSTLSCEVWLRGVRAATGSAQLPEGAR